MNTLFIILLLISALCVPIFIIAAVINLILRRPAKIRFLIAAGSAIACIGSFIGFGLTLPKDSFTPADHQATAIADSEMEVTEFDPEPETVESLPEIYELPVQNESSENQETGEQKNSEQATVEPEAADPKKAEPETANLHLTPDSIADVQNNPIPNLLDSVVAVDLSQIEPYSGEPYTVLNDNIPYFSEDDFTATSLESYSELDSLGRCGTAYAVIGRELMPTEARGAIGNVKPSGWHTVKYSDVIEDNYLYNRCHLIAYQLAGENANEKNLITGTRYLNLNMIPFEDKVANYVNDTDNHVLYRVTPVFDGSNLVATGVHMEATSVEDRGAGVRFNVFLYNVQPDITINYADGSSELTAAEQVASTEQTSEKDNEVTYVLNKNTKKFHYPSCSSVETIKPKNREDVNMSASEIKALGYVPCKRCNPK